jgi:hypothetical protein
MLKQLSLGMAIALLVASSNFAFAGEEEEFRETFEAWAVAMGVTNPPIIPPGTNMTIQINITRWTTEEEREALFAQLVENGQEGLVRALRDQEETGWTRPRSRGGTSRSTFPRETLRYSRQIDLGEGKRRVILALDRPISFREAVHRPRWNDFDMTLFVMDLDENGEGEGQLYVGVRLALNNETKELVIENFGSEPVRLNRIRKR